MSEIKPTAELKYDSMQHKTGMIQERDEASLLAKRFLLEFSYEYDYPDTQSQIYKIVEQLKEKLRKEHKYIEPYLVDENGNYTTSDTKKVGGIFIPDELVNEVFMEFVGNGIPVKIGDTIINYRALSNYSSYEISRMVDGLRGPKMAIQHSPREGSNFNYKIKLEGFTKEQLETINEVLYGHLDDTFGKDENSNSMLMARYDDINGEKEIADSDGISTAYHIKSIPDSEIESLINRMSESGLCVFEYGENGKDAQEIDIEDLETKLKKQIHRPKAKLGFGKMLEDLEIVPDAQKNIGLYGNENEFYYRFDYQSPEQQKIIYDIIEEYSSNPQSAGKIHPYLVDDNGRVTTQDTGIVGGIGIPLEMINDFTKRLIESGCEIEIGSTKLKDKYPENMDEIVSDFMIDEIATAKEEGKKLDNELARKKSQTQEEL